MELSVGVWEDLPNGQLIHGNEKKINSLLKRQRSLVQHELNVILLQFDELERDRIDVEWKLSENEAVRRLDDQFANCPFEDLEFFAAGQPVKWPTVKRAVGRQPKARDHDAERAELRTEWENGEAAIREKHQTQVRVLRQYANVCRMIEPIQSQCELMKSTVQQMAQQKRREPATTTNYQTPGSNGVEQNDETSK